MVHHTLIQGDRPTTSTVPSCCDKHLDQLPLYSGKFGPEYGDFELLRHVCYSNIGIDATHNGVFHLEEEEKTMLGLLKSDVLQSIHSENKDDILSAIAKLNEYSAPIAHRMMDINIGEALKGTKPIG